MTNITSLLCISTLAIVACQPSMDHEDPEFRCIGCTDSSGDGSGGDGGSGGDSGGGSGGGGEGGDDLHITECANDLIRFTGSIVEAVNAIPVPLASRTMADVLTCPVDTGVGEESHVNIFSYVGPLDKGCNRGWVDDCTDPDRSNYWISVVDDRRPAADPYSFQVIWGDESRIPNTDLVLDYYYYGSCSPDPYGYDNLEAGIPRLLTPVNDNNGDGQVSGCVQNHVYVFKFYTLDGDGMKVYIEKDDIAHISTPFLMPAWIPLPGLTVADHDAENSSAYVGVKIMLKDPQGTVIDGFVEANYDLTEWVQWKSAATCGAP